MQLQGQENDSQKPRGQLEKKDYRRQYAGGLGGGGRAEMEMTYAVSASSKPNPGSLGYKDDCLYPETCGGVWKSIRRFLM